MIPVIPIVLSLALPAYAIHRQGKGKLPKHPFLFSIASFLFCGWGIIEELFCVRRRLFAGDIGGIEDTIGAVLVICIVLLVTTTIANLLLLGLTSEKN